MGCKWMLHGDRSVNVKAFVQYVRGWSYEEWQVRAGLGCGACKYRERCQQMNWYELDECRCRNAICRLSGRYVLIWWEFCWMTVGGRVVNTKWGYIGEDWGRFWMLYGETLAVKHQPTYIGCEIYELTKHRKYTLGRFCCYNVLIRKINYNLKTEGDGGITKIKRGSSKLCHCMYVCVTLAWQQHVTSTCVRQRPHPTCNSYWQCSCVAASWTTNTPYLIQYLTSPIKLVTANFSANRN